MSRIVVGLDDSDGARHALRWAVDHAAAFGASVEVVHAYEFRPAWIDYDQAAEVIDRWRERAADGARACIHRVVADTLGEMATVVEEAVRSGRCGVGADRSGERRRTSGGRIPRPWPLRRGTARLCQPAMRRARSMPGRRRPCPGESASADAAEARGGSCEASVRNEPVSGRPTIVGLHHVRVPVSDVLVSRDWYTDVLGFDPMLVSEEETSISGEALLHPSGLVVGLHTDPGAAAALKGFCVLGLGVDNLPEWVDYLDRSDISHGPVELGPSGKHVCINDPDGLVVELHTLAQPSTEDT